jgi:hypothetical protein
LSIVDVASFNNIQLSPTTHHCSLWQWRPSFRVELQMLLPINDNIPTEKREYNILLVTLIFNIYFFNKLKR